ncbi:MAG: serine/threonine protein phosphatase [Clostridiales bacterium 43-6]|nr:MAG: serine/threonine protein phosphatase [Clostridiales bacterium 43-6]
MIYITGDTHGDFRRISSFCDKFGTKREDIMIILGDAGINYFDDERADKLKERLSNLPITLFCLHGNHENRPQNINTYHEQQWNGGTVFVEDKYPNLLFAKDGEIFNIGGQKCIVIGGAYSVDKFYRLQNGYGWWPDEQPSEEIKAATIKNLAAVNNMVDVVLSHTCPFKYIPREVFLAGIDQSTVDNSTEKWLDTIEDTLEYKKWYCGHYHTSKKIDRMCLNIVLLFVWLLRHSAARIRCMTAFFSFQLHAHSHLPL